MNTQTTLTRYLPEPIRATAIEDFRRSNDSRTEACSAALADAGAVPSRTVGAVIDWDQAGTAGWNRGELTSAPIFRRRRWWPWRARNRRGHRLARLLELNHAVTRLA